MASERLAAVLAAEEPLGVILRDEALERAYRSALRVRSDELVRYLASSAVLDDMLQALVSEERNMAEASEALAIVLNNLDAVTSALVSSHLPRLFSYLDAETLQPRRAYFFLRAASFLFQNRTSELFAYVVAQADTLVPLLLRHLRVQHVAQLVLNMLAVERQHAALVAEGSAPAGATLAWSEAARLVPRLAALVSSAPDTQLDALHKFLSDLCAQYALDAPLVRQLLTVEEGALLVALHALLDTPRHADAVVKLLDSVVLPIIARNLDDAAYSDHALSSLRAARVRYAALLAHRSLSVALAGAKLVQALAKHGLLLRVLEGAGEGEGVAAQFVALLFAHKWANVLHEVVSATLIHAVEHDDAALVTHFLAHTALIDRLVAVLEGAELTGNRGHALLIAHALRECPLDAVTAALAGSSTWQRYLPVLVANASATKAQRHADAPHTPLARIGGTITGTTDAATQYLPPARTVTVTLAPAAPPAAAVAAAQTVAVSSGEIAAKRLVLTPLPSDASSSPTSSSVSSPSASSSSSPSSSESQSALPATPLSSPVVASKQPADSDGEAPSEPGANADASEPKSDA